MQILFYVFCNSQISSFMLLSRDVDPCMDSSSMATSVNVMKYNILCVVDKDRLEVYNNDGRVEYKGSQATHYKYDRWYVASLQVAPN